MPDVAAAVVPRPGAAAVRKALESVLPNAAWSDELSFTELGGDSLAFVQFILALGNSVPEQLLQMLSPAMPMAELDRIVGAAPPAVAAPSGSTAEAGGSIPVTGNRYAFLGQIPGKLDQWISVSPALHVAAPYSGRWARSAVGELMDTFDGLRLKIRLADGRWTQELAERDTVFRELPPYDPGDGQRSDERLLADVQALVSTITLADQPVYFAFAPYASGEGFVLVILVHHALCDAMSKVSLYRRAIALYGSAAGLAPAPLERVASYADYARGYHAACSGLIDEALDYWRDRPWHAVRGVRRGYRPDPGATSHEVSRTFEEPVSRELLASSKALGMPFSHLALAAVAAGYQRWTGEGAVSLGLVNHGRSGVSVRGDLLGTVGWISEVLPFVAAGVPGPEVASRESLQLNRLGRTFDYLRYLVADPSLRDEFAALPVAAMSLNILASERADPAFALKVDARDFGWDYSWRGERVYPISGGLVLNQGRLRLSWDFDPRFAANEDMEDYLSACVGCLMDLSGLR